ncbi:SRPBCC domain-containing protein [Micromonospora profundi]|uniref:SRPBCC domain-containing protein n=1 Tax=Micromonospora profundi TaxID=1420889 RepID=UPI00367C1D96
MTELHFPSDDEFPTDMRLQRGGKGDDRLRLERHYDNPVERVWQALTDSEEMSAWFACAVEYGELTPGSTLELRFPGGDPEPGKILEVEPGRLIAFTWQKESLTFEVTSERGGTRFVFVTTVQDPEHIPYSAAGYYQSVEEGLTGFLDPDAKARDMPSFDDLVKRVAAEWNLDS